MYEVAHPDMSRGQVRPASLAADLAKNSAVVVNGVVLLALTRSYTTTDPQPMLFVEHPGVLADAVAGIYNVGDVVYCTTATPNNPITKTGPGVGLQTVGYVTDAIDLSAGPGKVKIRFNGGV